MSNLRRARRLGHSVGKAILSRFPSERALALGVHDAKSKLRDGVVLCGFAILLDRLGVVSGHTLAALVHDAEVELRVSVPCSAIGCHRLSCNLSIWTGR